MKLIISFIFLFSVNIYSQWIDLNPVEPYEELKKIDFLDQNTGWIVGNHGIVLFTSDGGVNWTYRNTPFANLTYIDFVNVNTGYVSSENNVMYKTTNSGVNWSQLNLNNNPPIFSYYFADANTGIVAAGYNLIKTTNGGANWNTILTGGGRYFLYTFFINSSTGYVNTFNDEILKTTNFGNNWTSNSAPYGKIFFANENTGWLYEGNQFINTLRKTTNGGLNWFVQSHPLPRLLSLDFIDANTGYGVGSPNMMRTTNGGINWEIFLSDMYIADIKALNSSTAIISGGFNFIGKTTNSGQNWNNISKKIDTRIGVKFFDSNTGYIAGECGLFAKSTDGGNSWTNIQTGNIDFLRFNFLNVNTGWLLSNRNKVYKTTNAGNNFEMIDINTSQYLYSINFVDMNKGWISGDSGTILFTTNGGSNWSISNTGVIYPILKTTQFNNQNIVAITLDSTILVSTNMGSTWNYNYIQGENIIYDICLSDNNTAYAFGTYSIAKTTNSGLNWTQVSNDLPIGGKSVSHVGNAFYAVTGYNVYKSVNGGINWASSEIGSDPFLCFSISFINENTGWVAGESGSLFKNTNSSAIGIEPISNEIPKHFLLYQNYPNPFNPITKISFDLPGITNVNLSVYDVLGNQLRVLINEQLKAGKYNFDFDGSDLASGIYFYRLKTSDFTKTQKMILLK